MVHVASVATAAGDHNYDDNNNIHDSEAIAGCGIFFSGTYLKLYYVLERITTVYTNYTINNQ